LNKLARKFYDLAIVEGEGLGTVYEYLAKYRLLNKIMPKNRKLKVLIAGLPERYGYSLDFITFCEENNCDYEIVDERADKLNALKMILEKIHKDPGPVGLCSLLDTECVYANKHFDLALSCEVLQRLSLDNQIQYTRSLKRIAKKVIFFAPNGNNKSHETYSGLSAINMTELISQICAADGYKYRDAGYMDIPPWPPGAKNNPLKGVIGRAICSISLNILHIFSIIEPFYPKSVKSKYAHLIYIII